MLILDLRLPPSDHALNKQEQFTPPYGREPSELLALSANIGGIQGRKNKSRKLKLSKKYERDATHNPYSVNK